MNVLIIVVYWYFSLNHVDVEKQTYWILQLWKAEQLCTFLAPNAFCHSAGEDWTHHLWLVWLSLRGRNASIPSPFLFVFSVLAVPWCTSLGSASPSLKLQELFAEGTCIFLLNSLVPQTEPLPKPDHFLCCLWLWTFEKLEVHGWSTRAVTITLEFYLSLFGWDQKVIFSPICMVVSASWFSAFSTKARSCSASNST